MAMSEVSFNQERQIYEVNSPEAKIATYFVFPSVLQPGDKLPPLYIHAWENVVFKFDGEYNPQSDNLEFFIEGPIGYVYKISLQIDLTDDEPYAWKIKRHGHTNMGKDNGATKLFVPRELCLHDDTMLVPEQDVLKRWTFFGQSVPQQFGRLRLKVAFFPARCGENADNHRDSKGLYNYFDKEESEYLKGYKERTPPTMTSSERNRPQPAPPTSSQQMEMEQPPPEEVQEPTPPSKSKQARCCCFLAEVPHDHNQACGDHVHKNDSAASTSSMETPASEDTQGSEGFGSTSKLSVSVEDVPTADTSRTGDSPNQGGTMGSTTLTPSITEEFMSESTNQIDSSGLGCHNVWDIACLRADDGFQLLDNSTATSNPINACCGQGSIVSTPLTTIDTTNSFYSSDNVVNSDTEPSTVQNASAFKGDGPNSEGLSVSKEDVTCLPRDLSVASQEHQDVTAVCTDVPSSAAPITEIPRFERKLDLGSYTSMSGMFPQKLQKVMTNPLPKYTCGADVACPREYTNDQKRCFCNKLCEGTPTNNLPCKGACKNPSSVPIKRPVQVKRNFNQTFSFSTFNVGDDNDEKTPSASVKSSESLQASSRNSSSEQKSTTLHVA